ncbi:MAG: hypothetical protein M3071_24620 [Actinomycetota bacterium]|nr:hypothetical protein [Actinomycetota bacterium]
MITLRAVAIVGALVSLSASSVAISVASSVGPIRTLHMTGVVVGKIAKEGHQADRVAGPEKVDLEMGGKVAGTLIFTGHDAHAGDRGCSASPFLSCIGTLKLTSLKHVSNFSVTFGGPTNSRPNAPGLGSLIDDQNFQTGSITVKTGFKQFAKAHGRFPVVIQLNKYAK